MTDRIKIIGGGSEGPAIPESFVRQLREYDRTLLVQWNPVKNRFVVQQCIKHHAPTEAHNHLCERIYVFLCQDSEGCMMGLGDAVMNAIKARDVTKAGYGPEHLQKWIDDRTEEDMKNRERIAVRQADVIRHCSRFNRRQILGAFTQLENCGTPNR